MNNKLSNGEQCDPQWIEQIHKEFRTLIFYVVFSSDRKPYGS